MQAKDSSKAALSYSFQELRATVAASTSPMAASHPISLAAAPPSFSGPSPLYIAPIRTFRSPSFRRSSTNFAFRLVHVAREQLRVRCAASDPKMTEGEDGQPGQNKSGDEAYRSLSMQALIKSYKEAIINGDENDIPYLEAAICNIDKEKADLLNKATEISAEIASAKDKFLRLNADLENFRKRSDKDRLKFSSDIQRELIESLLPLVDNFEKAKQQIVPETEKEKKISTSYQGIYKQFVEIMRALRVSVVETVGKQFDPLVHEAVGRMDSHQFREGTILQEVQRGFLLGSHILRPAKVKVSNGAPSQHADLVGEKPTEQPAELVVPDNGEIAVADSSR